MTNLNDNRVLGRRGARQVTVDELRQVVGGVATLLSVIFTAPASNPDHHLDS